MRFHTRYQLIAAILLIFSTQLLPATSARGVGTGLRPHYESVFLAPYDEEPPTTDLGVEKTGPDQVNAGSDITYQITVFSGPDTAENTTLSDTLPAGLTFVSVSAPAGWTCMTPAVGEGGNITCTNPSLAASEGEIFTLVAHVPSDVTPGTFISNTAMGSTTTFDPNDENNSSTASTLVGDTVTADMTVQKTTAMSEVTAGSQMNYTILVRNNGPDTADNVTLQDVLPASLNFVALAQPSGWTCMTPAPGTNGTVSCSRPSMLADVDDTFTLFVSVSPDTPVDTVINNLATVGTTTAEASEENNGDTASSTVVAGPTAASGRITGTIFDVHGNPVSGAVIRLSGVNSRKTITDANGNYQFENVAAGGFYTVTPARANFNFNPFNRSFSLLAAQTEATFTAQPLGDNTNPLDTAEYFVRQQYLDILGREPDEAGLNYWSDRILTCGDAACTRAQRTSVAAAFFTEQEAQQTGSYIYDVYAGALGRRPVFGEYNVDRGQVVGGDSLEAAKTAFARGFVQRAEFITRYQSATTAESFVDALLQSAQSSGGNLSNERENLIDIYNQGGNDQIASRAAVTRALADNATFKESQFHKAFVLTEYFSYLRRNVDESGFNFWVGVLNSGGPGSYRGMVCSFTTSLEYQNRFSRVASHSNGECAQ
jgi:uncharacterized repeat protein (TIGR01451 family)